MSRCWIEELTDDELADRIEQRGVATDAARTMVKYRDTGAFHSVLHELLDR